MKKNIAFITGGTTSEREISFKSAKTILKNIDNQLFNVYTIIIDQYSWHYMHSDGEKIEVDKNDFSLLIKGAKITFNLAFIGIHGSPGEDGKLQGYLDMIGLKYTTCNTTTSAITMNKAYTKAIVKGTENLHLAKSIQIFSHQTVDIEEISRSLTFPVFVKPNDGGSSYGMSKVKQKADLQMALDKAFKEGNEILIEEFIEGREFTVGIVKLNNELQVLPITEVETENEFFDVEAKYTPGVAIETTPAKLTENTQIRVQNIAKQVYNTLNCAGVVRMDFILKANEGDFYFIEINTIPGQTETSFIPQQVVAMGMDLQSFYTQLIQQALK